MLCFALLCLDGSDGRMSIGVCDGCAAVTGRKPNRANMVSPEAQRVSGPPTRLGGFEASIHGKRWENAARRIRAHSQRRLGR